MAIGRFSDENLIRTSALSGGEWSAELPLANLLDEKRFVSAPARQMFPADPSKARIDAVLVAPRLINTIGVLFHTLGLNARYRVSLAPVGGTLAAPSYVGEWTPVHGRMFDTSALEWESPNWWTGQPTTEDLTLFRRHLWVTLEPGIRTSGLRIEFDDPESEWFDVGGLWACGAWSPTFNFDHGRELGLEARSVADEAPSGRVFHEDRMNRRRLTVTWAMLADHEANRLFDAGARCGVSRPIILLPDIDDGPGLIREAWPATFEKPPAPRRGRPFQTTVNATFKEIIA